MLTPEEVAALSDADLSEHVARQVFGAKRLRHGAAMREGRWYRQEVRYATQHPGVHLYRDGKRYAVHPDDSRSVLLVMEHMRQRWKDSEPNLIERLHWSINTTLEAWSVDALRSSDPEGDPSYGVIRPSLGRAVFEVATLSAQGMASNAE